MKKMYLYSSNDYDFLFPDFLVQIVDFKMAPGKGRSRCFFDVSINDIAGEKGCLCDIENLQS